VSAGVTGAAPSVGPPVLLEELLELLELLLLELLEELLELLELLLLEELDDVPGASSSPHANAAPTSERTKPPSTKRFCITKTS